MNQLSVVQGGRKKKEAPDKVSEPEVVDQLIRFLRGESPRFSDWVRVPRMQEELRLVKSHNGGSNVMLEVKDNTAQIVTVEKASEKLRQHLLQLPPQFSPFYLNGFKANAVVKQFRETGHHLEKLPKSVGFKSDPELVLSRLEFDPVETTLDQLPEHAPLFSRMLSRMSNKEAFLARMGSIFDPLADRKQAVWLYGPPDCGKSQFAFVLQMLCPSFAVLGTNDQDSSYFKAMLLGKRLGLVMEAGARFIRSEAFKATTGDGIHAINQKFQPIFNAHLDVLYFCFSNNAPEIPDDDSLKVRIIACKIAEMFKEEPRYGEKEFQALLTKELPFIAGAALAEYAKIGSGKRIPCAMSDLEDSIEIYNKEYLEFLKSSLDHVPGSKITFNEMSRFFGWHGYRSTQEKKLLKEILTKSLAVTHRKYYCGRDENTPVSERKRIECWEDVRFADAGLFPTENIHIFDHSRGQK